MWVQRADPSNSRKSVLWPALVSKFTIIVIMILVLTLSLRRGFVATYSVIYTPGFILILVTMKLQCVNIRVPAITKFGLILEVLGCKMKAYK